MTATAVVFVGASRAVNLVEATCKPYTANHPEEICGNSSPKSALVLVHVKLQ